MRQVFHPGEQAIQEKVGVKAKMEKIGQVVIRDHMPDQHREFFENLEYLLVSAYDKNGDIWATIIYGVPGFIYSPDPRTLIIDLSIHPSDPLFGCIDPGVSIGLLGIDLATRRRNRLNGMITKRQKNKITLHVIESFGNCPKYIQVKRISEKIRTENVQRYDFSQLDFTLKTFIQKADTFFIATQHQPKDYGCPRLDVSHRGGLPGFVRLQDPQTLLIPDYQGNNFFNTLGNISTNPHVSLLFIDFLQGHHLHLRGTAKILWNENQGNTEPETGRVIEFTLKSVIFIEHVSVHTWGE